ncbi:MAG TPA: hypothetical protein VNE21_09055, partial [Mycobacteriales bacterium]|nr:hypothetical protein [Mycobacteriales bacterium]
MHRRARVAALCAAAVLGAVLPGLPPLLTAGNALTTDEVYVVPANGVFQVQGHGWGHGHGMSQWGAQGAAQLGKTHGQILDAYYPGTSVGSVPDDWLRVLITADDDADTHVLWEQGLTASDIGRSGYPTVTLPSGHSDWRAIASGSGEQLEYLDSTGWHPYAIGGQLNSVGPIRFGGTTTARVPTVTLVLPGGGTVAYAGLIDAYRPGGGTVVTVVNVRLEDYVRGVVPH